MKFPLLETIESVYISCTILPLGIPDSLPSPKTKVISSLKNTLFETCPHKPTVTVPPSYNILF